MQRERRHRHAQLVPPRVGMGPNRRPQNEGPGQMLTTRSRRDRTGRGLAVATFLLGMGSTGAGLARAADVTLQGTGATFPAPLYQRWFTEFNKMHPEVQINYQALGSGAGVKQFQEGLVNFGASDAAMTDEEIAAVKDGVVLLPMTAGSVVLAYNLPGAPPDPTRSPEPRVGTFHETF